MPALDNHETSVSPVVVNQGVPFGTISRHAFCHCASSLEAIFSYAAFAQSPGPLSATTDWRAWMAAGRLTRRQRKRDQGMAVFSERRAHFYLEAYPRLLHQLDRLVEAVRRDDPNIASIVLFGATVRLHPRPTSSADLLFSVRDVHSFLFAPACPLADMPVLSGCTGVQLVRGLQRVPGDGWQLSGVVSDLEGDGPRPRHAGAHRATRNAALYGRTHAAGASVARAA